MADFPNRDPTAEAEPVSIDAMVEAAVARYGILITDNIDLSRIADAKGRARVAGKALIERGDARAFVLGRRLIDMASR